jgi:hypothetical protein
MDLGLVYMDGKLRHRPKTFMKSQRFKMAFSQGEIKATKEKLKSVMQSRHCLVFCPYLEF